MDHILRQPAQPGPGAMKRIRSWMLDLSIAKAVPDEGAGAALDLGCGYGAERLRALGSRLARGVGVDYSVSDEAKRTPGLRFIEDSIESALPGLAPEQFDLILCVAQLERSADPAAVLRQCHGLLAEGGRLLVDVPSWRSKLLLEFSVFGLGIRPTHEFDEIRRYYDQRALWTMLVDAGFRPSRVSIRHRGFGTRLLALSEK